MPAWNKFEVFIEYHTPDRCWVATFRREGEPFYLDGAMVGMEDTPGDAVQDLIEIALYLIEHGENFLTQGPISDTDRQWLSDVLKVLVIGRGDACLHKGE